MEVKGQLVADLAHQRVQLACSLNLYNHDLSSHVFACSSSGTRSVHPLLSLVVSTTATAVLVY